MLYEPPEERHPAVFIRARFAMINVVLRRSSVAWKIRGRGATGAPDRNVAMLEGHTRLEYPAALKPEHYQRGLSLKYTGLFL